MSAPTKYNWNEMVFSLLVLSFCGWWRIEVNVYCVTMGTLLYVVWDQSAADMAEEDKR